MSAPPSSSAPPTWIDVSVPVRSGMVNWPDNPPIELVRIMDVGKGDPATVSRLCLGVHSGTHVDAPVHFLADGAGVDAIPLDHLLGEARVVEVGDGPSIGAAQLRAVDPRPGERLLFKTRNSARCWKADRFLPDFVHLSLEAAALLAERGVRTVGIDYLSIAGMEEGVPTHLALLEKGICIIEGLDLSSVQPGNYELICLPLRLAGADGAPARVVLRACPPGR
jgi:arylformamidase